MRKKNFSSSGISMGNTGIFPKGIKKKERTKAVSNEMEGFFANEAELEKFIEEQEARTFRNFVCRK